jgi:HD superfamily phosphodiesterase
MIENYVRIKWVRLIAKILYPSHNYINHILPTVQIANDLSDSLKANKSIVITSAYLHDIGRTFLGYRGHAYKGYIISKIILPFFGYSKSEIHKISYCIRVHDSQDSNDFNSLESKIVANSDAIAQFENWFYLFSIYFSKHGHDILKTKRWLLGKLSRSWETKITLDIAKDRVCKKYIDIKGILSD